MPRCPECDERLDAPAAECPHCGAALPRKRPAGSAGAPPPRRPQQKRRRPEGGQRRAPSRKADKTLLIVSLAIGGVVAIAAIVVTFTLLMPGGGRSVFGRDAHASRNNLHQIGLAMHNYHDTFRGFPPGGIFDAENRGHHGWQTSLLPFIEQQPLYERIDKHRPWDDPVQGDAFRTEVTQYLISGGGESKNAQGLALSHYAGNDQVFHRNRSLGIYDARDGASTTALAGEAEGNFRPWGHPENWRNLAAGINTGPDGFGNPAGSGCLILLMDGAVRELPDNVSPEILKALSTPAGAEPPEF